MYNEATYRLTVVRPDGTRDLIATGIPEDRVAAMQQLLDMHIVDSKLALEPQQELDGAPRR